ncbi:MAG: pyrroline-5-carboxylate reductase [Candidatus Gracilibacteria bacterium]|nr:pyrroline-5-carboxylate reductase [Candidatus Gracilibacteria bacterium]
MKRICVIGLGNMGNAMFGILSMSDNFEVRGCDRNDALSQNLEWCDACIIAVKPQDFDELAATIKVDISQKLIISIMAGVSIDRIRDKINAKKVVRVMPNLPLRVQKALSGWIANENVSKEEKQKIKLLLGEFGAEVEVDQESKINMITALSGSGPAYFFKLTETLANAAKKYGFSDKEARKIAEGTFLGAAELLKQADETAENLRKKVTSKGGTTEAAFKSMDSNNIEEIFLEGIESARKRAEELNF